jgi:oligosaccharide repeat unit polymerase
MQNLPGILLRVGLIFAVVATLVLAPFVSRSEREFLLLMFGVYALVVTSIPIFFSKGYHLFEPPTLIAGLTLTGVTAKLLYIVAIGQDRPYIVKRLLLFHEPGELIYGTGVVVVGLAAITAGYMMRLPAMGSPALFTPNLMPWRASRLYLLSGMLFLVSLLCFGAFVASEGISFSNSESLSAKRFSGEAGAAGNRINSVKYLLYRGAALCKFPFYLGFVWLLSNRKSFVSLLGLITIIAMMQSITLSFVMSSRSSIVLLLIDAMVMYYLLRGKLELRKVAWGVAAVVVLLVVTIGQRSTTDQDTGALLEKTFAGRDLLDVSKSAHIINAVPSVIDYRYGETLYGWLVAPVPRSMWEDKPMWAERGLFLMDKVYGDKGGRSGIPPGMLAEFYWNFGWTGVIVGMFAMGVLLRQIFLTFSLVSHSPTSVVIYTVVLTRLTIFSLGTDFGTGFLKAGLDLVPLIAAFVLLSNGVRDLPDKNSGSTEGVSTLGESGNAQLEPKLAGIPEPSSVN